ncbi:MAG: ATP-dependent DNA helicase RecG [Candidatus Berkelbacteria bacterium]|nr:ATP-dependent DNA helicase RecG [Candidatus Berkelbacteria bacterium]MCR4308058.1 ATP-dependent DNA helicase RecG [Candidatus Berkelbacteria bacterium]
MAITKSDSLKLVDPVEKLPGVSEYLTKKLQNLGVNTIKDLLELIPRRMEDRSQLIAINQLAISHPSVIIGTIESVHSRRSKRGILIVQAKIRDVSGPINALWFNQRYLLSQLKIGDEVMLFGEKRIVPSLGNPFFVKKIVSSLEVAPIYPAGAGLYQATIRRLISSSRELISQFRDVVPDDVRTKFDLPSRAEAIEAVHFSEDPDSLERAKKLLAFEELLVLSTQVLLARQDRLFTRTEPIEIDVDSLKGAVSMLPYKLTDGQRKAAWQIIQDLSLSHPMYRLLYGEVGSGKTAVAMIASWAISQVGAQVVWLNPTAILAAQQAETLRDTLGPLGIKVALLTAGVKENHFDADIIVGTHALLEPKITLRKLGLIIIDEQHRFGVEQRQVILDRHPKTHLLMMSATPIPRSLAQSIFGHLDITYLLDKPLHQKPVETVVVTEKNRASVEKEIEKRITLGQPGFVICPLIYESSAPAPTLFTAERKAIIAEEKRLTVRYPNARIGVVHGRIKSEAREKIIKQFKTGLVDILLSTTVVEVGIDNPSATWILIEEADRFGLAQLHQLRGRVGRGTQSSICYLAQSVDTLLAKKRLGVLAETTDGLKIAQADLEFRGPGELVGVEQSGLPELKYASLSDVSAIKNAFTEAEKILKVGLDEYPALRKEVLQLKHGSS